MRKFVLVSALIGGAVAAFVGVFVALGLAALAWFGRRAGTADLQAISLLAPAIGLIAAGLGLALAWAGWRGLAGAPGRLLRLPRWGWWLLALGVLLIAGQLAQSLDVGWLATIMHLAAGIASAFLVLAWTIGAAESRGWRPSARPAIGSLAWGGLGGAGIAVLAEMFLALAAVLLAGIFLSLAQPDWLERLQSLMTELERGGQLDARGLAPLVRSPWVWLAALTGGCVVVPFIEELAKSLAVPLVAATGRRLTRLDGFLFGAAAGAGFGLLEGFSNGSLALGGATPLATVVLARLAASGMHALATGVGGLGWQAGLTERRWPRAAGCLLLAMLLHGAWNFCVLGSSLNSLNAASADASERIISGLIAAALVGLLGLLGIGVIVGLAVIPRRLAREVEIQTEVETEAETDTEVETENDGPGKSAGDDLLPLNGPATEA